MALTQEDLDIWFTYHQPTPAQIQRFQDIRNTAKQFADLIYATVPAGRERSVSIDRLREAVMWANAGIACNE